MMHNSVCVYVCVCHISLDSVAISVHYVISEGPQNVDVDLFDIWRSSSAQLLHCLERNTHSHTLTDAHTHIVTDTHLYTHAHIVTDTHLTLSLIHTLTCAPIHTLTEYTSSHPHLIHTLHLHTINLHHMSPHTPPHRVRDALVDPAIQLVRVGILLPLCRHLSPLHCSLSLNLHHLITRTRTLNA